MSLPTMAPKDRLRAKELIDRIHDTILEELPDIIQGAIDLAKGAYIEESLPHGKTRVYRQAPDNVMIQYLTNRVMGKIPDRVELGAAGAFTWEELVKQRAAERLIIEQVQPRLLEGVDRLMPMEVQQVERMEQEER